MLKEFGGKHKRVMLRLYRNIEPKLHKDFRFRYNNQAYPVWRTKSFNIQLLFKWYILIKFDWFRNEVTKNL